jgi:hypothetical protein
MHRLDPETGAGISLAPDGVTIASPDGSRRFVPAPTGYRLSHFEADGGIVGHGRDPVDGWYDWHFVLDGDTWRRGGPAY